MVCGDALTVQEKDLLLEMLFNREAAMAWDFSEMGKVKDIVSPPQQIRTIPHDAWQAPGFPVPKALHQVVIDMLKDRIKHGILEPCHGPYRNPWFLVKKKSNKYRMINAAMNMNKVTIRDANLPPDVDGFSEEFAGMVMTSLIDLFSGYDQITLAKTYRDLTAFMTPLGLLRQTTLPQGATNSVAQFVRVITKILEDLLEICRPFLDDIGVKGPKTTYGNVEVAPGVRQFVLEHIKNLDSVLLNFELAGCTISGEKSQFCMPGIKIVGFVCDFHGRRPEGSKIIKILEWRPCHDVTSARAFIGVCVYYRVWIENFALVAAPIFQLFKKGNKFVWGKEQEIAMDKLKMALTTAPAMKTLNYSEKAGEIVLAVDASLQGWGAVLQQGVAGSKDRHPVRYESGLWNEQETRYDAGKRECRGLMKALKKVRYWLYGTKFVIEIDANTLVAQLNQSASDLPGALVTRWLAWIRLFDFDVRHVPGRKHSAPDGLSRRPRGPSDDEDEAHEEDIDDFIDAQLNCIRLCPVSVGLEGSEPILEDSYSDHSQEIARYLTTLSRPSEMSTKQFRKFKHEALKFLVQDKHLFKRSNKTAPMRRVVDLQEERSMILQELHDESGQCGRKGTYRKVADRYWWEEVWKDTCAYVKSCEECQLRAPRREEETLHPTWTSGVWEKVGVDVVYMPPNEGKRYIVLARDDFSGWVEGRALGAATSEAVARFLWEDVICRHGCPGRFVMDGGPENKGIVETLAEKYKIKRVVVSAYHPQANGLVERGHTAVVDALAKMTAGGSRGWVKSFASVLWADRTTVRTSTGMAPYRVLYGCDAVLPIELDVPTWQVLPWGNVRTTGELLALRARQLERRDEDLEEAALHLRRMREADKDVWDDNRRVHASPILEGDLVLLHDTKLDNMHTHKLAWRWLGPFRVMEANTEKGWYILAELDGAVLKGTVAGNRLKKRVGRASESEVSNEREDEDQDLPMTPLVEDSVPEISVNVPLRDPGAPFDFIHY